jgi:hypothetical protein
LYHLTLQFLGEVPDVKIRHIAPRLAAVAENFPRYLSGFLEQAVSLPCGTRKPSGWDWIITQSSGSWQKTYAARFCRWVSRMRPDLNRTLRLAALDRNASDEQKARVAQQVTAIKEFHAEPEYFRELILYQSVLTPSRPVYTALSRFPLKIC